jgi:hypothetical protein
MAGINLTKTLASLALENLEIEERPSEITKSTLEVADLKQTSPGAPPPLLTGVLQASPPRNRDQLLGSPLPALICRRGPLPGHGERITSWPESIEHPRRRRQASVMEVEKTPSYRRRITVALLPTAWMSTIS